MRLTLLYSLIVSLFLGCGALAAADESRQIIERKFGLSGPRGGEFKEIRIWGLYIRESEEEVREVEDYLRTMGYIKDGESAQAIYPNSRFGEERYNRSGQRFCDHVTDEETKSKYPVINPNLRVRLYDRAGNVLSEDFLRDEAPENTKETAYEWYVIAYVPYREEGYKLRLVRLENGREILLDRLELHSRRKLYREIEEGKFYAYLRTTDGCLLSPPMK